MNLSRMSLALQVMLVILVIVVLGVASYTLVNQNQAFAQEAEQRAAEAELSALRTQAAIESLTCILLIPPDERSRQNVAECGAVFGLSP